MRPVSVNSLGRWVAESKTSRRRDGDLSGGASLNGAHSDRPSRRGVWWKFAAKWSAIGLVISTLLGTAGSFPTHAQGFGSINGVVVATIPKWAWKQITNNCGPAPDGKIGDDPIWFGCFNETLRILGLQFKGNPNGQVARRFTRTIPSADANSGTSGLFLGSGVPYLPFLGNRLVELGFVPNSTNTSVVTAAYTTDLRRQADCSLDEDFIAPTATTPSTALIGTVTGAQDYLHTLAGLTTKADVFAKGCDSQILGVPGTGGILLLGATPSGVGIAAQFADSGLFVILTDPTANTTKTKQLSSGQNPGYFSAASLRNNGIMDLVETALIDPANQKPATAVFLGNGDGTFQSAVYYDISDNGLGLFTIDDVNGDGKPDIVELTLTNFVITGVATLLGKGDGTFTVGPASTVSGLPNVQPITGVFKTGDVKDVLVGGTVLLGAGDGSFTVGPSTAGMNSNYLFPPAAGDLRNSGKLDVVVSTPSSVNIFYGKGDGSFEAGPTYAALPDNMDVTITDIDGDGNLDVVMGTSTLGVYTIGGFDTPLPMYQILMGRGDGTFVDSRTYVEGSYNQNGGPQVAGADFNGDGKTDVLVFADGNGISPNSLLLLPGDGTGALGAAVTSTLGIIATQMISADMNGDGKPDAVVIGGTQVGVLFNQGNGTFSGEQDYTLPNTPVSLAVGDFNGDGNMDVAVGVSSVQQGQSGTSGVFVLLGKANHTLGSPTLIDSSLLPTGLAAGSFTSSGRTDLVVADQGTTSPQVNGGLHVYLGNADGTFTAATAPTTSATAYSVAAVGDLNNDGKPDLIVAGTVPGTSGNPGVPTLYTILGAGNGTFQAAVSLALADSDGVPNSIALADFNKSGNVGVLLGNLNDYTEVLLGNGDGTLDETLMALGQRPLTVAAADLLGNGYPELLVAQQNTLGQPSLAVFHNLTAWTAPPPALAGVTTSTTTLQASASSVATGQSVTFTAKVTSTASATIPTGTVSFLDGATSLGTGTLSSGAVATFSTTTLAAGAHSITAVYGGDGTFASSTSAAVAVTVGGGSSGNFTLAASSTSATVAAGSSATSSVSVTPSGGFNQPVSFTCSGLPTGASCSFSPATVTPTGTGTSTTTMTITTSARSGMISPTREQRWPMAPLLVATVLLSLVGLSMLFVRWLAEGWKPGFRLGLLASVGVLTATILGFAGCGGSSGSSSAGGSTGTPSGTSTVTITATAGSTSHTTTFMLTVQ